MDAVTPTEAVFDGDDAEIEDTEDELDITALLFVSCLLVTEQVEEP